MADRNSFGKKLSSVKYQDLLVGAGLAAQDLPEELKGKPAQIPVVNFKDPLEKRVRAKSGPPPYAVRAKEIEDTTEGLHRQLRDQWGQAAQTCAGHPDHFARIWRAVVESVNLIELNHLIKEHNTFYPIEANLQPDPATGRYMIGSTPWKPKPKITPDDLLQLFPADLDKALAGANE